MIKDSINFVKKCRKYQQHAHFYVTLTEELSMIMSHRLFSKWGIYLLGPFSLASEQVKYLIIVIDYFTKWVKAELLSTIIITQAQKFVWRNIFIRFKIPDSVVTYNRTQFIDQNFEGSSPTIE